MSQNGVVTGVAFGNAKITAVATSGVKADATVTVTNKLSAITLNRANVTLGVGRQTRVAASVAPEGADDAEIVWSSDKPHIASVENGMITGVTAGKAVIKARDPATGIAAKCEVTVVEGETGAAYELTVINGQGSGEYPAGEAASIKADAPYPGQRFAGWISEESGLVITSPESAETTLIMPESSVTVTALYENVALAGIAVSPEKRTMYVGDKYDLTASAQPSDADFPAKAVWTSDAESVATVDENGMVTAIAQGEVNITAKIGEFGASCLITVKPAEEAPKLELLCDVLAVQKGKTLKLEALSGVSGAWSTGDENIAKITKKGKLKALKLGETTLKFTVGAASKGAKFMGKSIALGDEITIKLFVVKKGEAVKKINVKPAKLTLMPEETATLSCVIKPKKALHKTVFWHSDDPSVVTVDENGVVTGVGAGKTSITAMSTGGVYATVAVEVG